MYSQRMMFCKTYQLVFSFILMVHFVHVAFAWIDLLFKDQQICAGIRELDLQMTERDARWGAYLEGNGWMTSGLTGEQENNVKKESWKGKASTALFFSSLWSCHPVLTCMAADSMLTRGGWQVELPPSFRLPETPPKYTTLGTTIKVCPKMTEKGKQRNVKVSFSADRNK